MALIHSSLANESFLAVGKGWRINGGAQMQFPKPFVCPWISQSCFFHWFNLHVPFWHPTMAHDTLGIWKYNNGSEKTSSYLYSYHTSIRALNAKSPGTTFGDMELSCENQNHHHNHDNGTLHLYLESIFTCFTWYDFREYKRNIVCRYIFLVSRCQIIPFPFVENALNPNMTYVLYL